MFAKQTNQGGVAAFRPIRPISRNMDYPIIKFPPFISHTFYLSGCLAPSPTRLTSSIDTNQEGWRWTFLSLEESHRRSSIPPPPPPTSPDRQISFSNPTDDGTFLVSASKDGKPMIRAADSGDWIGTFEGHNGAVWGAALNYEALLCATASADFSAKVWDACSGELLTTFEHKHIVRSVCFAPSSHVFATGCQDKAVRLFDVTQPTNQPVLEVPGLPASVRHLCYTGVHMDVGLLLATCVDQPGVKAIDPRTGTVVLAIATPQPVTCLEMLHEGRGGGGADDSASTSTSRHLLTTETDGAKLWDLAMLGETNNQTTTQTQPVRHVRPQGYAAEAASLHVGTSRLVMGGSDMWVHLIDWTTGEELEVCRGHHGPVHTVQWNPAAHGKAFASGSEDGTIRIWNIVEGGATTRSSGGDEK